MLFRRIVTWAWRPTGVVLLTCCGFGLLGASSAFAASKEFKPTGGAEQEFVVPGGVTHIEVSAVGGAGHAGRSCDSANEPPGGAGAKATAQLTVKPSQKLYVDFGGGGAGGNETTGCGKLAGAGGDASDVREEPGGNALKSLQSRLLVAGGGGGGGGGEGELFCFPLEECSVALGGAGGSSGSSAQAGKSGESNVSGGGTPGGGGEGGGSVSGGKGGSAGTDGGAAGSNGVLGEGGAGAAREEGCNCGSDGPGGGGGGGYYGGGGGGSNFTAGGGGGAGSSLIPSGGTLTEGKGEAQTVLLTYRADTTLTTSLSGEGKKGEKITVTAGTEVTDHATLSGENASTATGKDTYTFYEGSECTKKLGLTAEQTVKGGKSEQTVVFGTPGTYIFQVSYSGDANNAPSQTTCESEVVTVTPATTPTTLTTSLSGEGKIGEKITVKEGEGVSDQATLSGENASKAGGKASYRIYSDNQCSKEVTSAGEVEVSSGKVPASENKTLAPGTYYWQASYSGDAANEKSLSECGAEVETVLEKVPTATCGKTTVGKSSDAFVSNQKRVNACPVSTLAIVSELTIYLAPTSHSGSQVLKGVFYADSKGKPGTLLGATSQLTFTSKGPAGWYHLVFEAPLHVSPGNYWIGVLTGSRTQVAGERYDSVAKAEDYNTNSYTSGPSNPFGSFKTTNEQMSLYATFTRGD